MCLGVGDKERDRKSVMDTERDKDRINPNKHKRWLLHNKSQNNLRRANREIHIGANEIKTTSQQR